MAASTSTVSKRIPVDELASSLLIWLPRCRGQLELVGKDTSSKRHIFTALKAELEKFGVQRFPNVPPSLTPLEAGGS
jgi:hypothetical protein